MRAPLLLFLAGCVLVAACGSSTDEAPSASEDETPDEATTSGRPSEPIVFEPSPDVTRADVSADAVPALVAGFNDAGFDLIRSQQTDGNLVLSPTSIGHALLMARAAADDPTGTAIDQALALPQGLAAHDAWNAIDTAITESNGTAQAIDSSATPVVTIADRIWPSQNAKPDQAWIDLLAAYHGADVEAIDTNRPDESRATINSWISDQTNELIPELIAEGFINDGTQLVLTDAVYFKAQWRHIFGKYGEVSRPFDRLDGSSVDVTLLRDLEQPGRRGVGDGYVGAELRYLGGDYSMLLIVPDEGRFEEIRNRTLQRVPRDDRRSVLPRPIRTAHPGMGDHIRSRSTSVAYRHRGCAGQLSRHRARRLPLRRRSRRRHSRRRHRHYRRSRDRSRLRPFRTARTRAHRRRGPALLLCDPPRPTPA